MDTADKLGPWREKIEDTIARGDLLQAYDLAVRALEQFPEDPWLRFISVLVLARAGATRRARAEYAEYKLGKIVAPDSPQLQVDLVALDARIAKDEAFAAPGATRDALLAKAADRYRAIFRETGDYYPGINATALLLLGGDTLGAEALAREVLRVCSSRPFRRLPIAITSTRPKPKLR